MYSRSLWAVFLQTKLLTAGLQVYNWFCLFWKNRCSLVYIGQMFSHYQHDKKIKYIVPQSLSREFCQDKSHIYAYHHLIPPVLSWKHHPCNLSLLILFAQEFRSVFFCHISSLCFPDCVDPPDMSGQVYLFRTFPSCSQRAVFCFNCIIGTVLSP